LLRLSLLPPPLSHSVCVCVLACGVCVTVDLRCVCVCNGFLFLQSIFFETKRKTPRARFSSLLTSHNISSHLTSHTKLPLTHTLCVSREREREIIEIDRDTSKSLQEIFDTSFSNAKLLFDSVRDFQ
jgi:hypothetical protein